MKMKAFELLELEKFPQPEPVNLDYPVLLCHGLGALGSILKKSLLHDVCTLYRLHCIKAVAPNIVPYAQISVRAQAWAELVPSVLELFNTDRLHIVAHSMAGLDIRYMIHQHELSESVISLTTVASPHRGSSLTGLTLNAPDSVKKSVIEIANWFGNNVYPEMPSDMLGALEQLSPEFVESEFNPNVPNHENVVYQSVISAAGKGTDRDISKLLIPFNTYMYDREGQNDGYVGKESAKWGDVIGETALSHLEQINVNLSSKRKPEWQELWLNVAKSLGKVEDNLND